MTRKEIEKLENEIFDEFLTSIDVQFEDGRNFINVNLMYIDVLKLSKKEYDEIEEKIEVLNIKKPCKVFISTDGSGYDYWKNVKEHGLNYIDLNFILDENQEIPKEFIFEKIEEMEEKYEKYRLTNHRKAYYLTNRLI